MSTPVPSDKDAILLAALKTPEKVAAVKAKILQNRTSRLAGQ